MSNLGYDSRNDADADLLISKIPADAAPVFQAPARTKEENRAILRYLYSRRPTKLPPSPRQRLIGLYDPLADRSQRFHDGLRWCMNVYVGCEHNCGYCYVNGYSQDGVGLGIHAKDGFESNLQKDISDLASLGVPPAPLHLSNSTDPLQATLETEYRHTLHALAAVQKHRSLFTHVVILTKNPGLLGEPAYLDIVTAHDFQPFTVQVTCAYSRDEPRQFFEPKAPSVASRLAAIEKLCGSGVSVELRIDPLFPSMRLEPTLVKHRELVAYGVPEAQSQEDIEALVAFAAKAGVKGIVAKPLRVPISKFSETCKGWFGELYRDATGTGTRVTKGRSWRLPEDYQKGLMQTLGDVCAKHGLPMKHCMHDVLSRK